MFNRGEHHVLSSLEKRKSNYDYLTYSCKLCNYMSRQYTSFPFEITDHVVELLERMVRFNEGWHDEPFYLLPYERVEPSFKTEAESVQLLTYLQRHRVIEIKNILNENPWVKVKTPMVGQPKIKMLIKYKVAVINEARLNAVLRKVRAMRNIRKNKASKCQLSIRGMHLYLYVDKDEVELKKFNTRGAHSVFKRLCIFGVVERDHEGYIKGIGISSGMEATRLDEVVRNAGFNARIRDWFFNKCEPDLLDLNRRVELGEDDILYIFERFEVKEQQIAKINMSKKRETTDRNRGGNPFSS